MLVPTCPHPCPLPGFRAPACDSGWRAALRRQASGGWRGPGSILVPSRHGLSETEERPTRPVTAP